LTLTAPDKCKAIRGGIHSPCDSVEAFIDTGILLSPYPPVFYRCYFTLIPTIPTADKDIIDFEWSASSEYIEWYVTNMNNSPGDISSLITTQGGIPPTSVGVLVPLLKVTNHSPRLF
jgi:hypothetical protein